VILQVEVEGPKDGEVDGPHPGGGGIFVVPGSEEGSESVDVASAVQSRIGKVQSGEFLPHGA
jgi:hypothetical protein